MCGLTIEKINEKGGINPNKFLSYLALSNSATDPWNDFDIDKSIVVEDFETNVQGEVDYIDSGRGMIAFILISRIRGQGRTSPRED